MTKFFKLLFLIFLTFNISNAYDINDKVIYQKDFEDKTIYLPLNNYRTLIFDERIKNIQLTNSENIRAEFIENKENPLKKLKVLGKNISNESALITLESGRSIQINFSIMQNLDNIISIVKLTYPNLIIEQANNTIILKGSVKNYKEKDKVIDIFEKFGVEVDKKLVDLIETSTSSKMIRIKLYAVEINNDEGLDLKNNWLVSSKNYMSVQTDDGYYNEPLDNWSATARPSQYGVTIDPTTGAATPVVTQYTQISKDAYDTVNNQRNLDLENALNGVMTNAVSLSGGLSGFANYLGKYFNAGLVLQYLATEGVANIIDETTLLTLENKEATFLAGGTIRVKTQSSTAEGLPVSTTESIEYGLKLNFKAKNIMNDEYIDLEIETSSSEPDFANLVDGIPNITEKTITTNVLAKDRNTIVLGGLINNNNTYSMNKIPFLGDIPVLGFLFRSKAFKEGKSELVFFITPEVVDPSKNNQTNLFNKKRKSMLDTSKFRDNENILERKDNVFKSDKDETKKIEKSEKENKSFLEKLIEPEKSKLSPEEAHKKRVNKILGY